MAASPEIDISFRFNGMSKPIQLHAKLVPRYMGRDECLKADFREWQEADTAAFNLNWQNKYSALSKLYLYIVRCCMINGDINKEIADIWPKLDARLDQLY